jgi:hypothetical protein
LDILEKEMTEQFSKLGQPAEVKVVV